MDNDTKELGGGEFVQFLQKGVRIFNYLGDDPKYLTWEQMHRLAEVFQDEQSKSA